MIELFDSHAIDRLPAPANERAQRGVRYLTALVREGPLTYIDNADVRMLALGVDGLVVPLVVSEEKADNADVCSPYSHYVAYTLHEMARRRRLAEQLIMRPLVRSTGVGLKAAHLDKVVYVNNWLFATNPCPDLSPGQIAEITDFSSLDTPIMRSYSALSTSAHTVRITMRCRRTDTSWLRVERSTC